jgi:D-arginine dehydrogenase
MRKHYEVIIVGGGIAGASLAYRLAELGMTDIAILEREPRCGQHASGRSASTFSSFSVDAREMPVLVEASAFFRAPPAALVHEPILDATGVLLLFDAPDWPVAACAARELAARGLRIDFLDAGGARERMPVAGASDVAGALYFPDDGRVDVPRLLDAYLGYARRRGAEVLVGTVFHEVLVDQGACTGVVTSAGTLGARWVVNAAGAWAGHVAVLAGATPIPFHPCRRTVITFDAPGSLPEGSLPVARWPLVSYESRGLYFGPEAGGLLACPMDEDLVTPGDAVPNPAVIEQTRERLEALVPAIAPGMLRGSRAGLRTFAPDRGLVLGEDPLLRGFFWLAGQGGWGIESSPIVSRIAAELIARGETSWAGAEAMSPARFVR